MKAIIGRRGMWATDGNQTERGMIKGVFVHGCISRAFIYKLEVCET